MNVKFNNRRTFHRIRLDGQVDLDFINGSYDHCQIKNLSLSGMFVMGNFQNEQDEDCLINVLHNADSKEIHLRASAKVVWHNEEGIAFKFISMRFDSYMSLVATLINEAEEPSIILEELPKNCPFEISGQ